MMALKFEEPRGLTSVGDNVRHAAAYVCWVIAKAFEPRFIEPYRDTLAENLLAVACFDREALCRRAAVLALQQFVERAVNIPHGVEITTAANFHSVGSCSNAYLSVSMEIAQYKEYTESLIKHLLRNKVDYWDCNIRILTAKALHKLASRAPEYMASDVLTELFALIVNDDPKAIHGAVLAIGELVWALSSISQNLLEPYLERIENLVGQLKERNLMKGALGDIIKTVLCSFIA
ncbi:tubulin-specific chaperone D-like [Homalodisca vitripennis]|uniref:tubulin-specific chaperone D-like n=1 Tax=Homalodisca vitripennis TaxID=197043 RepID=UPI001EE9B39F|nr:tubulin-specific chaperone D-like [Homalodisca vitripennis]XP_046684143.1 tubulin-specific chaperone D-like [Homalodisca vitripennis]